MEEDYYKILGVERTASADEIKRAYKKTAIKYHPDRNPGDKEAEEMFKKAAEAYDVLRDEQKRARYDRFGKAGVDGMNGGGFSAENIDLSDIFGRFADIFAGAGMGGFGSGFGGFHTQQSRGADMRLKVRLTQQEINKGVTKKFKVKKDVACPDCHGRGTENGTQPEMCPECRGAGVVVRTRQSMFGMLQTQEACPRCHGTGTIITHPCPHCHGDGITLGEEIIEVNIPAGVQEGMVVNLSGKGGAAPRGGEPGDIQVIIEEEQHPELLRDGQDLIYNLLLTIPQATLGDTVDIPTLDGKARIKIKPGTQPGTTLRLRGKGHPAVRGYGYGTGDIVVNISVYIPQELSKDEEKAFEAMRDSDNLQANPSIKERIFETFRSYFKQ